VRAGRLHVDNVLGFCFGEFELWRSRICRATVRLQVLSCFEFSSIAPLGKCDAL
jgi:hypothetical protein